MIMMMMMKSRKKQTPRPASATYSGGIERNLSQYDVFSYVVEESPGEAVVGFTVDISAADTQSRTR